MITLKRINQENIPNNKKEQLYDRNIASKKSLSIDESVLLKKILEEYNDLFPEIMHLKKEFFQNCFQKYIQIYFASKNILFSIDILNKIMAIIQIEFYLPEKEKIENLIKLIDKSKIFIDEDNKLYSPHCYKTRRPVHTCGDRFYKLDNGKYYYCLKCNKIYDKKSVLLFCENCKKYYYSEIKEKNNALNLNKIDYKLKPATWVKYHCNASMNDTMKCPKCHNNLFLNMKNKLFCVKCNYEIDQLDIIWKCQICGEEFKSEAKEYNPLEFKVMKLSVKNTIFNGIEAKPSYIPCCIISNSQFKKIKFTHKKECNGLLYQGILDNKKIVVCLKCNMINFYDNHFWMCPLCKNKFKLNNNYENNLDERSRNEKTSLYQDEKFIKRNKKIIKSLNDLSKPKTAKKRGQNFVKFEDDILPKSFKEKDKKSNNMNIEPLPLKKQNSGFNPVHTSDNLYQNSEINKKSINNNSSNNNISKYQSKDINSNRITENYIYNNIKKKSLYGLSKSIRDLYLSQNNNENYKHKYSGPAYSREKPNINISQKLNELNILKKNKEKNLESSDYINKSNKLLRILSQNNLKQNSKRLENFYNKKNYFSNDFNNMNNLYNISKNNLSNININLNVNVNINNTQKENLLKNISSQKYNKKQNLLKEKTKGIETYKNYIKNNSLEFLKNNPQSSLNNFDIDDYNIVKPIGEGAFGKIFEAEDKYHRKFAMKKLICNSIKEIEILKKEYEILYNFDGFNINLVQIYGIETKKLDKTTFVMYVLMELAKADWEKEIMQRKKFNNYYSEKELIHILKDLTKTLSYLQQNSISHRDIKPQNILLCDNGILKISDFGEAKENIDSGYTNTLKQTIRGTELYMSPALFKTLKQKHKVKYIKHNTYKSDVFSLGYCILLAATLNFDCLFSIRELNDMILIKNIIVSFVKNRYSNTFLNILFIMLEIDERNRPDFIQLENIVENL